MPVKSIVGRELGFDSQTLELVSKEARYAINPPIPRARGRDWYVHSGTGNNSKSGKSYKEPLATIDAAFGKVTADQGDRIIVMEGHAETLSSATALLADVAGVEVIGLGRGAKRPTITLDTGTDTTIAVSAARIRFSNIIFSANYADIVSFFTLAAAKRFELFRCRFQATATNMNALYVVDTNATTADADGLTIQECEWVEPDLATVGLVKMDGTNDDVKVLDNYCNLGVQNNKSLITVATGKIVTNLQMLRNRLYRLNTDSATGALLFGTDGSTNTGIVADNYVQHADTASELLVTASSGLGFMGNYASGVAGASGYLLPAADS